MKCEIHKHHIYVKTPFHMKDYVKHTLNGVWTPNKQMYRFPLNIHCLRELYTAFPALRDNPEFIDAGRKLRVQMGRLLDIKRKEDADGSPELRPYQRVDVEYLKRVAVCWRIQRTKDRKDTDSHYIDAGVRNGTKYYYRSFRFGLKLGERV